MHYYQHHIGDFIRDTARLTDSQTMAYLRLIWLYYESEEPLPNKPKVLALKIGSESETVELILEAFFQLENDQWNHTRCNSEIKSYQELRNRNKTNGKAGGRPKKTQSVSSGFPDQTQSEPCRNPNQEPITNNQEPIKKQSAKPSVVAESFERFWQAWPQSSRKVAKKQCLKTWERRKLYEIESQIVSHVEAMKKTKSWIDGYDPQPSTYLGQDRWEAPVPDNRCVPAQSLYEQNMAAAQRAKTLIFGDDDEGVIEHE